jgi:hypothetical protein
VYRLKNEGQFVRVRRGGDHWEVDSPDGKTLRYGVSSEARVESASGTFSWALEDVLDRFGNRIAYTYQKDGGEPYLVRIDYNLRPGAAENRVVLEYEQRPDPIEDGRAGNGDRMLDLVYVLEDSVTYWPSLGWGRFGDPVGVGRCAARHARHGGEPLLRRRERGRPGRPRLR